MPASKLLLAAPGANTTGAYSAYATLALGSALAFGAGAIAFFAVPYTVVIYPILFLVFPRMWRVCH